MIKKSSRDSSIFKKKLKKFDNQVKPWLIW